MLNVLIRRYHTQSVDNQHINIYLNDFFHHHRKQFPYAELATLTQKLSKKEMTFLCLTLEQNGYSKEIKSTLKASKPKQTVTEQEQFHHTTL